MGNTIFSPIIPQQNIKSQIVGLLAQAVLEGKIQPGQKINESRIARELRVSRSPLREALHQLQEQGLIENVERRGMFVVALTEESIEKINSVRVILEAEALALARAQHTPQSLEKLAQLVELIEHAHSSSPYEMTRLDLEFHRTIWRCAGNEYLEKVLNMLTAPLFANSAITLMRDGKMARGVLDSHRPLLEFVQGKSTESAEEAMIKHLTIRWKDPLKYSSIILRGAQSSQVVAPPNGMP